MERAPHLPRFERTGTNEAGYPILERVRREHEAIGTPEVKELDRKSKGKLRFALALVGALGAGAGVKVAHDRYFVPESPLSQSGGGSAEDISLPDYSHVERPAAQVPESGEVTSENSEYNRMVNGYVARFETPYNAIVFVDDDGHQVGEPVPYQEFIGPLPEGRRVESGQVAEYRYTPSAEFDKEIGFPIDGVSAEWVQYVQQYGLPAELQESVADSVNVNPEFASIFRDESLAELQERIVSGKITTYEDVVVYFIEQPFAGARGLDRYDFAVQNVRFRNTDLVIPIEGGETVRRAVPPEVQRVFRELLPGLIANESTFRDLTSTDGARGPLQILPSEWKRVTGEDEVDTSYARQVGVWGEIISDFYDSTLDRIGDEALSVLRSRFVSEEEFQRELAARLALGAYNAGPRRMAEVVRAYVASVQVDDMPRGADLFQAITEFGRLAKNDTHAGENLDGYDAYASTYVQKLEAAARVLRQSRDEMRVVENRGH